MDGLTGTCGSGFGLNIIGSASTPEEQAAWRKRELEGAPLTGAYIISAYCPPAGFTEEELLDFRTLVVGNGRGKWVICIHYSGRMEFNPEYEPTEQARAFAMAMNVISGRAIFETARVGKVASAVWQDLTGPGTSGGVLFTTDNCKTGLEVTGTGKPAMDMDKLSKCSQQPGSGITAGSSSSCGHGLSFTPSAKVKVTITTQMPCGCQAGRHPPGPCGITGLGQVIPEPESPLTPKKRSGYINT